MPAPATPLSSEAGRTLRWPGNSTSALSTWAAIPHVITVTQKARTVWEAVGDYRGEPIRVKGSSADVAINYWADAARIKDRDN